MVTSIQEYELNKNTKEETANKVKKTSSKQEKERSKPMEYSLAKIQEKQDSPERRLHNRIHSILISF